MGVIELSEVELSEYRDACDRDSRKEGPEMPTAARDWGAKVLQARGVEGEPDKVTVTFRDKSVLHLYSLHYS